MNTTISQVHDAMRNYRSLLARDWAKVEKAASEKDSKRLESTDTVHISKDGVEKLKALELKTEDPAPKKGKAVAPPRTCIRFSS